MSRRASCRDVLVACGLALTACASRAPAEVVGGSPGQWMGPQPAVAPPPGQWMGQPQPAVAAPARGPATVSPSASYGAARPTLEPTEPPSSVPEPAPDPECHVDTYLTGGDLDTLRYAVSACVGGRRFDDRAEVAALARMIGTRSGEREIVKCRGGFPDIVFFDAKGRKALLIGCAQTAERQLLLGGETLELADGPGLRAWLRSHGIAFPER